MIDWNKLNECLGGYRLFIVVARIVPDHKFIRGKSF